MADRGAAAIRPNKTELVPALRVMPPPANCNASNAEPALPPGARCPVPSVDGRETVLSPAGCASEGLVSAVGCSAGLLREIAEGCGTTAGRPTPATVRWFDVERSIAPVSPRLPPTGAAVTPTGTVVFSRSRGVRRRAGGPAAAARFNVRADNFCRPSVLKLALSLATGFDDGACTVVVGMKSMPPDVRLVTAA